MCKSPGAGTLGWPEWREGGTVWQPHCIDVWPGGGFGSLPLHLFPLPSGSLPVYFFESHYGLDSFKCIWNEISNVNSVVRCKGLISLWFFFIERYLWISGEDMRILIVLIVFFFFLVWPHYVNFPIVLGYENIKAITHLYGNWMFQEVVMETRGSIHIG